MGSHDGDREPRWVRGGLWFCWWLSFALAWLALTGTVAVSEIITGAVAAAAAATVAEIVRVQDYRRFRPRLSWLARSRRLPALVASDTLVVFRVLYRRITGRPESAGGSFRAFRFDPGGDDGRSAARRALIVAAASLTPNTIVVGIDDDARIMLVHQLEAAPPEAAREEVLGRL